MVERLIPVGKRGKRVDHIHHHIHQNRARGELVGHADLMTTARTYTHVLADEQELDYALLTGL
jgi:integrase